MDKRARVVMLPSNEKAPIWKHAGDLHLTKSKYESWKAYQHLYTTSDNEIKEGDWCYNEKRKTIIQGKFMIKTCELVFCKKIIATTDSSLIEGVRWNKEFPLPQPSQSFIQKYVEEYNKGNIITDVMVEYDDTMGYCDKCSAYQYSSYLGCNYNGICDGRVIPDIKLKVSKDNTITIRRVKDSWSRDEVIILIKAAWEQANNNNMPRMNRVPLYIWIEENL